MKPLALALLVLAGNGALAAGAGKIQWREGRHHDAAFAEAKATGVPLMIYFSSDCCGACTDLSSNALSDDDVVRASEKLIRVHADAGQNGKLFSKYAIKQMPTLLYFSPDGEKIGQLAGRDTGSVQRQFEEIAGKHTRGPRWMDDAAAALDSGKADATPVVLVFADGKAKSEQLLKSFGDAAYKNVFEKFAFSKVPFKKDCEVCKQWAVTEAPTMVIIDARGEAPAAMKSLKGLKSPKDFKKELEEIFRKFEPK